MTNEQDLSHDYERDVLLATWEGFVTWLDDGGIMARSQILKLPMNERQDLTEDYWKEYVEDLQYAYMDSIENQRMKWSNA